MPVSDATGIQPDVWLKPIEQRAGDAIRHIEFTRTADRQYVFICRGDGEATLDGWRTPFQAGEVLIVPSRTVATIMLAGEARLFWFGVADSFLISRVLPALGVAFSTWSSEYPMPRKLSHWIEPGNAKERERLWLELTLAARRLGGAGDAAVAAYVILTLFEKYNRPLTREAAGRLESTVETLNGASAPSAEVALVIRFRCLIEHHLADQWKVHDYCEALEVRSTDLGEACRNVLDTTPSALIHERLLLDAKRHLAFSRMPSAQIAYALGFSDPAYFSRYFKKQTGQSPLDFRRSRSPVFPPASQLAS